MGCVNAKAAANSNGLPPSKNLSFDKDYTLGKELGSGAYAVVYECTNKATGRKAAVKIVDRSKLSGEDDEALKQEVAILRDMKHGHVVQLFDFYKDRQKYYLVLEICLGGELFDRIVEKKSYNEKEARDLVRILFDTLRYCHSTKVVHRDLKPENLLLEDERDDANIKLADFGFAQRMLTPNSLTTQCGTPGYVAPEILKGIPYGEKVDVWSAGVITYILLGGYPPFYDENQGRMFRKIKRGDFKFHSPMWDHVSPEAKDLIKRLLVVDPHKRLDAAGALKHAWILTSDHLLQKRDLAGTVEEMKKFNAKRKFRGAAKAVILMHRLKGSSMSGKLDDSTGDGEGMDESGPPVDFKPVRDNILATNVVATA
ncbi:myosin light chain kinase [Nannochloropsis gaditana]|uniref:non-specific serine/threonine protein kinase n=1 Tax=Nannochloropsis gaditana TaxID=72520 RepID=W7TFU3_9STRA|nr:myosin light chain kinase [Nannochloropsis gaditana]